jgi:uncharacterized protein YegP (UPF0339 family)
MPARFDIKAAADATFYFVLVAANGEPVAVSETYKTRAGAIRGAQAVKRAAMEAVVPEQPPAPQPPNPPVLIGTSRIAQTTVVYTERPTPVVGESGRTAAFGGAVPEEDILEDAAAPSEPPSKPPPPSRSRAKRTTTVKPTPKKTTSAKTRKTPTKQRLKA